MIRGHKWFATAVDGAAFGGVMAMTDPENPDPDVVAAFSDPAWRSGAAPGRGIFAGWEV